MVDGMTAPSGPHELPAGDHVLLPRDDLADVSVQIFRP